ncbi:MaoC family dehydratase [Streptomyces achromogenes]|uniref:MaoC family dehydratase n=1 Tax=Streptomyces achromogenes TaxID=67255 RepID=UPI003678B4D9
MHTVTLAAPPALGPLLARGALRSPFKHPAPGAPAPRVRLVLPGVRVDLARLAAYERVCGFPTGESALPLTYPHVLGFPLAMRLMSGRDFPLPLLGLVHTYAEIERSAALPADGEYELSVWVKELTVRAQGTEAVVATAVRSDGEVVWSSRSGYLARTAGGPERRGPAADGERLPTLAEWRLGADVGRRYGAVSGDRNPIHLHPLTARLFGFPRPIAHGMWTLARCLAAHGTPARAVVRARFRAPVPLPGTVAYGADGAGRFELRGESGRLCLVGTVRGN